MKKQLLTIFCVASISLIGFAQNEKSKMMPCGTFDAMDEGFKTNPELKKQYEASQAQFEIEYQNALQNKATMKTAATIYTVPVVFHIMGNQNITDQVFINFIANINNDYARLGNDTGSINSTFKSLYVDAGIQFALAKKDPLGNCTNGIIRHNSDSPYWNQTTPNYAYSGTGTNRWPTNKYLNVYIVDCIASSTYSCPVTTGAYLGGYTYLPGSTPYTGNGNMGDAIVYLKSLLGQSNPNDSRTLSHEMGHWLNLSHTFGSSNNPVFDPSNMPTSTFACSTDNVSDTPPTGGYFSVCTTSTLDCSSPPNIENIMDYASCPKMFTQGQVTRMRTAIVSATGGRNNLWTPANYLATGLNASYTCTPVADLKVNKVNNCLAGNSFTYTSMSQLGTSGNVSWIFQGGTPATSTATSQVVTYATAGTYSVSITATNTAGTNTMNKISYINVIDGSGGLLAPSLSDFDAATLPSSITVTNGNAGSVTWVQNTATGANTTPKSIYINNASATATGGHLDLFQTPIYNFANTSSVTLSYSYAYAKRLATQADTFRIQYSLDCGGSWVNILGIPTTAVMASASGGTTTTAFVPTAAQWIAKTIITGLFPQVNGKPSVMFRFYFRSDAVVGRSNNIYIDQINIAGNIATGLTELEKSIDLALYPNPTSSSSTLEFTILNDQKAKISVVDIMGRVFESNMQIPDNNGHINYTINQNGTLASGVYIVNIEVNNQRVSKKLIIE